MLHQRQLVGAAHEALELVVGRRRSSQGAKEVRSLSSRLTSAGSIAKPQTAAGPTIASRHLLAAHARRQVQAAC